MVFSHSDMALGMAMSVCWSVDWSDDHSTTLGKTEISHQIDWIVMTFCTSIHVCLRMNFNNFDDPLTFPVSPSSGQSFYWSSTLFND